MSKSSGESAPSAANDLGASEVITSAGGSAVEATDLPAFLVPLLQDLSASPIAEIVRSSSWVYPCLETVHVVGLGLLFGGIFLLDLRLLGVNRAISMRDLSRHVLPWVWFGFALNVASGIMLFASDALKLADNISFQLKMLLLVAAAINACIFQLVVSRDADLWDVQAPTPATAKASAAISIGLWMAIIMLGRLIAYWS